MNEEQKEQIETIIERVKQLKKECSDLQLEIESDRWQWVLHSLYIVINSLTQLVARNSD